MQHVDVAGRRVLVTGASSGIGEATARLVARLGGTVLLVARRADELERITGEIRAAGGSAHHYPVDLTDHAAIDALAGQVLDRHGGVDVLVNNAGHSIRRSVVLSLDRFHDYERTMRLNYFGPLRLTLALLPGMLRQGEGHVVNVTSQGLQVHTPRFAAYLASKAALEEFGRTAHRELAGQGVTFTSVRMPLVRTPMIRQSQSAYRGIPAWTPAKAAKLVLKGIGRRTEVVHGPFGPVMDLVDVTVPRMTGWAMGVHYRRRPETAPEARGLAVSDLAGRFGPDELTRE
jgi:NAD(P)-dependent dehydrogenase (short-subunit alcohol dehydrogenase family)